MFPSTRISLAAGVDVLRKISEEEQPDLLKENSKNLTQLTEQSLSKFNLETASAS